MTSIQQLKEEISKAADARQGDVLMKVKNRLMFPKPEPKSEYDVWRAQISGSYSAARAWRSEDADGINNNQELNRRAVGFCFAYMATCCRWSSVNLSFDKHQFDDMVCTHFAGNGLEIEGIHNTAYELHFWYKIFEILAPSMHDWMSVLDPIGGEDIGALVEDIREVYNNWSGHNGPAQSAKDFFDTIEQYLSAGGWYWKYNFGYGEALPFGMKRVAFIKH